MQNVTIATCSSTEVLTTEGCVDESKLINCPTNLRGHTRYTLQHSKTGATIGTKCMSSENAVSPTKPTCLDPTYGSTASLVGGNNTGAVPTNACYVDNISTPHCAPEYTLSDLRCIKSGSPTLVPTFTYSCPKNTTLDRSTSRTYCLI
jgi:hypothetical protein